MTSERLALYDALDQRLAEINPEEYIAPEVEGIPSGSRQLGTATEPMKRLWTLWSRLEKAGRLGDDELLRRVIHVAISFEIAKHFDCWRARIGINSEWQVYAMTSQ